MDSGANSHVSKEPKDFKKITKINIQVDTMDCNITKQCGGVGKLVKYPGSSIY